MVLYDALLAGMVVMALIVAPVLLFITAPYGRHQRPGWGPTVSSRMGWLIMEAPASLIMLAMFLLVPVNPVIYCLLLVWQVHYFHRAFIYPFTLKSSRPMPVLVMLMAVAFNLVNAGLNGWHFVRHSDWYDADWLQQPVFIAGGLLFAAGYLVAKRADATLAGLRQAPGDGYRVPTGPLYRWVSCPNYLGESVQWLGWALMTQAPAAWVFLLWTLANLVPRAISHHRWYRQTFPDYPPSRRAFLPFIL